ncbi:MAG: DNA mismatch repair protein MutS [Syntrophomonadaceae bacterium]|nr:DNA mismatch repair protein MutS [Syntrophomonadaceae bacterium]
MMKQYLEIKELHTDAILFFRLGDFYEMFFEDAKVAAKELEIVLTSRDTDVPMCGVPHHAATNYIAKLVDKGYKVAICEQVEDPKTAKGIVKREVVQVITKGTILENSILDEASPNYLAALYDLDQVYGLAYIDITTGDFWATEFTDNNFMQNLNSELLRINPAECLIPKWSKFALEGLVLDYNKDLLITYIDEEYFSLDKARQVLIEQYGKIDIDGLGLGGYSAGLCAAATVISFLESTQNNFLQHLKIIKSYSINKYLEMDYASRKNLELTTTLRDNRKEGSLLSILDYCATSMGKRALRNWIEQPLTDIYNINLRLAAVEELKSNISLLNTIGSILKDVYDLERLAGKIGSNLIMPRDFIALKSSLQIVADISKHLSSCQSVLLKKIAQLDTLSDLYEIITKSIMEPAPMTIRDGYIFSDKYDKEIDELRKLSTQGSKWLLDFEKREKERLGIKNLKIGFNRVFGYYIELSKSNVHLAPPEYHRKQTLVNGERFICEELKNYEDRILGAREKLFNIEYEYYNLFKESVIPYIPRIQATAYLIATLDVLYSLAYAAYNNDYIRPELDNDLVINIKNGRHPIVEKYLVNSRFVPNDLFLDGINTNFAIITGPNMGGKSTYMRQTALLVLMAQMGSFIPAESARIGIVDKIFTRVGASDDLAAGQSTFMLEMVEVANILNNATENSLIILDEIGRGTSTYDGLSIAKAVSEYILTFINARTLFATHYHELTSMIDDFATVINLSVSVKETGDTVVFLKKVLPGQADKSYGIHVAKIAGLPNTVITRADEILVELESYEEPIKSDVILQPLLFDDGPDFIKELKELNVDEITPKEALSFLYKWKKEIS